METNGQIVMLSVDSLRAHPDNPRKDLGDLTELSESIKVNGVLQNLTVVPTEEADGNVDDKAYTIIIGHRRAAAAKLAGIKELPCVITHMDKSEQVTVMLCENLQRNNLTIYEQAKAFEQLKFDFGMSECEISKKSGFSKSTVKGRLEIAKLDEKRVKEIENKGVQISLNDFEKLEGVESVEKRNELLKLVGDYSFDWNLERVKMREKGEKLLKILMPVLSTFATKGWGSETYSTIKNEGDAYGFNEPSADEKKNNKFRYEMSNGVIIIYKDPVTRGKKERESEGERDKRKIGEKKRECRKNLDELCNIAWTLRYDFVRDNAEKIYEEIDKFLSKCLLIGNKKYNIQALQIYAGVLGADEIYDRWSDDTEKMSDFFLSNKPDKITTVLTCYGLANDLKDDTCHDYEGRYIKLKEDNKRRLYKMLEEFGYKTSADERALIDGTHSAYYRESK